MNFNPKASFFAGVNGAGKTTLYYDIIERGGDFGLRINIDEIVSSFGDWKSPADQWRAAKIALKMRQNYIKKRYDFHQETTLCGAGMAALFSELKDSGYKIALYFVGVDSAQIAIARVAARVKKGGHHIAPELIYRRYTQSMDALVRLAPLCDSIELYDNTTSFIKIASISDKELTQHATAKWLDHNKLNQIKGTK